MPNKFIRVDGGLVTSRDPATLNEGELTRADDAYYKPNDIALWKRRAQSTFNETAESKITGLRFLEFDGTDPDYFVTTGTTAYRYAIAGDVGTFADLNGTAVDATLALITEDAKLDSVHYNNHHYLLNGIDRNHVVVPASEAVSGDLGNGNMRFHGMLENTAPPVLTDPGALAGFTLTTANTITYWVEERVKSGDTILRRNSCVLANTVTLTGDGTNQQPRLSHPAKVNVDATHWALYGTATNGTFPVGAEIGETTFATAFIDDTRTGTDPSIPSGAIYETMEVMTVGVTNIVPLNGPPPIASTGDIYEDSLVLNDVSDLRAVKYSVEDTPDAFPSINRIRFETKEQDEVRLIRRLGNTVMVVLRDSLWRINILPRPEDSSFEVARIKDEIDGAFGCVGPLAGDTFSWGGGFRLAYISLHGVVVTDGASWDILTDDLDWSATFNVSMLSKAVLRNNPEQYRLELYAPSVNSNVNNVCYFLHYHPSHAKAASGGNLRAKVTGPITIPAVTAVIANVMGLQKMFTANAGVVHLESGNEAGSGISYVMRTGDYYLNQIGGECRVNAVRVHHGAYQGQEAMVSVTSRNEGDDDVTVSTSIDLTRREATQTGLAQGEAMQFGAENSDELGEISINLIMVDWESLGRSEEG